MSAKPKKRSLIARLFGPKKDEGTERFQKARLERAAKATEEAERKDQEQSERVKQVRKQADSRLDDVCEQTISLSGMFKKPNGKPEDAE